MRRQRDRRVLPGRRRHRHDARLPGQAGGLAGAVRARACTRSTTPAPGSSSRSAPRRRCTASSRTSSASTTTCWRSSPTTRSSATRRPSTRRCAACRPPGWAAPAPRPAAPAPAPVAPPPPTTPEPRHGIRRHHPRARPAVRRRPRAGPAPLRRSRGSGAVGPARGGPGCRRTRRGRGCRAPRAGGHHRRRARPARRARRSSTTTTSAAILAGQQFIGQLPQAVRQRMVDMHITRLVKSESGAASFETIDDPADVIKLAGRHAPLDVVEQFGVDAARDEALDIATRLAIGAGFDALRDAGIPLVHALQDHHAGHPAARPLGPARRPARRHRRHLRLRVPRLRPLRRGPSRPTPSTAAAASSCWPSRACGPA